MSEPTEREWLEGLDPRTEQERRDEQATPVSPVGGEGVARLREVAEAATPGEWNQQTYTWKGEHGLVHSWELTHPQKFNGHVVHPANIIKARGADHEADSCCWPPSAADARHIATFDPPTVLALLDRLEAAESARDEALAVVERVRALADIVHRLQEPDPDSGDRDVSFFALLDALDPDDAALTPSAPTEETS